MININGDLFAMIGKADCICITTNGTVKKDGSCVMGRGCALEAKNKWPDIPKILGENIIRRGNIPSILMKIDNTVICSFPVKHNWFETADLDLMERSANMLIELAETNEWNHIVIPRPGSGNGHLDYHTQVEPLLKTILDDRFLIITNTSEC